MQAKSRALLQSVTFRGYGTQLTKTGDARQVARKSTPPSIQEEILPKEGGTPTRPVLFILCLIRPRGSRHSRPLGLRTVSGKSPPQLQTIRSTGVIRSDSPTWSFLN